MNLAIIINWDFILNSGLKELIIALGATMFAILIKAHSRSDSKFKNEDFAVGFELAIAGVVAVIFHVLKTILKQTSFDQTRNNDLVGTIIGIITWGLGLTVIVLIVKRQGWSPNNNGSPELTKIGIALPVIFGAISLAFASLILWGIRD